MWRRGEQPCSIEVVEMRTGWTAAWVSVCLEVAGEAKRWRLERGERSMAAKKMKERVMR